MSAYPSSFNKILTTVQLQLLLQWVKENQTIVYIITATLFGAYLWHKLSKLVQRYKNAQSRKQGSDGEVTAEAWLKKNGFTIISTQTERDSSFKLAGKDLNYKVRPDIMASNKEGLWIIEVKTGKVANPHHIPTRRQLLEYSLLFPEYKLALFDAHQLKFQEVNFKFSSSYTPPKPKRSLLKLALIIFIIEILSFILIKNRFF